MFNIDLDFLINYFNNLNSVSKITVFLINWAVLWLPIVLPIFWFTKWQKSAPNTNPSKLTLILSLYFLAPVLIWGVTIVENISISEIGIIWEASFFKSSLLGYILSISTLIVVYSLQLRQGWTSWKKTGSFDGNLALTIVALVIVSFIIGAIEEIIFRGVFVNWLNQDYSLWLSAIVSSAIFAVLHLIWEQKNTMPQLPGLFLMGLVLFYSLVINDQSLGLAIGLHSGWVLILACVDTFDLFDYNESLLGWIVGKKEQPLGSLMGLTVLFLTITSLYFYAHFYSLI